MRKSRPCAMIKEGSTCLQPSFVLLQMLGSLDSTQCEIGHSRMGLQSEPTGPWLKELQPCFQSLVFPCLSGVKPLPPLCTSLTAFLLLQFRSKPPPISSGMAGSQMWLHFAFGAVLLKQGASATLYEFSLIYCDFS